MKWFLYDAARKTLEAFSTKLRDETNLEALNNEVVGMVRETCNLRASLCGCASKLVRR
jgi:hypothetical protein